MKLFDDDGDEPELLLLEEELKSLLRNEFFRSKLLLLFEDDAADAAGEAVVGNVDGAPDVGSEAAVAEAGSSSCTCFNADAASFLERRSDPPIIKKYLKIIVQHKMFILTNIFFYRKRK